MSGRARQSDMMNNDTQRSYLMTGRKIMHVYFFGRGARSATGISRPLVSTNRGGGVPSESYILLPPARLRAELSYDTRDSSRSLLEMLSRHDCARLSSCRRSLSRCNIPVRSSSSVSISSSSSSSNSPSAVSWSGGAIHSFGTTHGNATPMLAARFSHAGAVLPVNRVHNVDVKWLQLFVRRLYRGPWNSSATSLRMASISFWLRKVKPCRTPLRKVPPGGSRRGRVE